MPTDSKRELIIAQLVTNLKAVVAGTTYFNTFKTVTRDVRSILDIPAEDMPLIMAVDEMETKVLDSNIHTRSTLPVALPFVKTTTPGLDPSTDGNRMILDLERLLIAFHETTISSTVVDVTLTGNTKVLMQFQVEDRPNLPIIVGEVRADIRFRTQTSDPGAP
jgi:hypothetical protein